MSDLAALHLAEPWFIWVVLGTVAAGLVRGLSGFGSGMVLVPILGAAFGPAVAVPLMIVVDGLVTAPLLPSAFRRCHWREVLPITIGGALLVPVGVRLLTLLDAILLRRITGLAILVLVIVMALGWRYARRASPGLSFGVGALSGTMGGAMGIAGPPVILFWLGGQADASTVRANVIAYFGLIGVISAVSLWLGGLFTREVLWLSVVLTPVYAVSLWLGVRSFRLASERTFRRLSLALIALIALGSLFG
jgi:uncharacterized membrane protein YfcA